MNIIGDLILHSVTKFSPDTSESSLHREKISFDILHVCKGNNCMELIPCNLDIEKS